MGTAYVSVADIHEQLAGLDRIDLGTLGKDNASDGPINLRIELWTEHVGIRKSSVLRLDRLRLPR